MEKDNFDEEFKSRIKQVFEEYNDSAADEGWNLLREKYPEKKRRDHFFWWISGAALLLIALAFGLFQADFDRQNASKITKQRKVATDSTSLNNYSAIKKSVSNKVTADTIDTKKTPVKTASDFANFNRLKTLPSNQKHVFADSIHLKKTSIKTVSNFASSRKSPSETVSKNQNNAVFIGAKSDSAEIKNQQNFAVVVPDSTQKTLVAAIKKVNPTISKPVVKKYPEFETAKKITEKSAAFSLEVYAGSHINYASGSNNQLGLGAGFSTDFRLSKNFKLSTGLGLLQNNLTYAQDIPRGSLNAATASYSVAPANVNGFSTSAQTPNLNSMNTHLIALDVPVNLVYSFLPGKNSISVSAGISSNTFVKEAYDYHYSNATNTTQNIGSFNNFNFARTLNLAAGFAYPLGKSKLQIEPFLKYPLGGSGTQQLLFGSAGINLKMNIQAFKK